MIQTKKAVKEKAVSREEFDALSETMNKSFAQIIDLIEQKPKGVDVEATKKAKEVEKIDAASPDVSDVNPRYDATAKKVLGDKLERTFVTYPEGGGTMFTVVINKESSNAPKDYLERMKEDRRTVNIERDGFKGVEGVEKWSKLILQNLGRPQR